MVSRTYPALPERDSSGSRRWRHPAHQAEQDVLIAVAKGLSNAEICADLHMSLSTAETHLSHLLMKLGTRDRTQLLVLAYEAGFAVPGTP
jgi:DNA-binding NarL/FixJ family response regulator